MGRLHLVKDTTIVEGVNDGGDGGGDDMHERVKELEKSVQEIKTDTAIIRSNYATKSDVSEAKTYVSEAKTSIIIWVVSAVIFAQLIPAIPAILRVFFPG